MTKRRASRARALLPIGTRLLGRYEIVDVIGRGGMSIVYKARDLHFPHLERWVAVKEMTVTRPRDREQILAAFEREAHLLAQLRHPAVPVVFDYFTQGDKAYLVLEFIEGKTLDRVIRETPGFFPEKQVLQWGIELCDVLHYLHTRPKPIIFRDLKPANIMVQPDGHLVLIDFGIARLFDPEAKGTIIGTEGYAPPEQYRGIITPLVDIYALGATLHHILTKRDPRQEPPFSFAERPIRKINPNVSPELEAVVYKALSYRPEDRFQSAAEMKAALEAILQQRYGGGDTRTLMPTTRPIGPAPAEGEPRTTRSLAADTQGLPPTRTMPPDTQVMPPDTRAMPAETRGMATQTMATTRRMAPVQAPRPVWTFACEDEIRSTAWVQGSMVLIGSYDFNLYALRVQDGHMLWKFPTRGGVVTRPVSDGRLVYFGSEDGHVYALRLEDARQVWSFATSGPVRCSPRLHQGVLYIGSDDGFLYALHAASGRLLWKFTAGMPVRSTPWVMEKRLYFGTEDGEFFCLDLKGQIVWQSRARRAITSSPVGADNVVYFASLDAQVYALNGDEGWELWRYRMGKGTLASPTLYQGRLFIGAADGVMYCLQTKKGKEQWRFQTEHQVAGSALIVDGRVYFGATDHKLYCLAVEDGSLIWSFATQGPITGTPVYDERTRLLFIGSFDRHLYALPLE